MSDGSWICDYCDEDVACAESDEYYLWTSTHGWMCGDCRKDNWNTMKDSVYSEAE